VRLPENIERFIKNRKPHVAAGADIDNRILDDSFAAMAATMRAKSVVNQPNIRRIIMKNRITKLAAVAGIVIIVFFGLHHFGNSIDGTSTAFADVLNAISKAKTISYKEVCERESGSYTTENMVNESGVMRSILLHNLSTPKYSNSNDPNNVNITIWDLAKCIFLQLSPKDKRAYITHRVGEARKITLLNYVEWFSILHEKSGTFAGQDEIDGKITNKFICDRGEFTKITAWVDPATNLPVRVEQVDLPNPKRDISPLLSISMRDFGGTSNSTLGIGGGISEKQVQTMTDFVWNAELDESLFSVTPPEGYAVEENYQDVTQPDEKDLIKALSFWTEMSDGMFPDAINDLGDPNQVKPLLIKKFHKDGPPKEELDLAVQQMHKILKGLYFAQEQKVNGSWGYTGNGVELGDSAKPVCWWKAENSKSYRVIYGNLSIGDANSIPLITE
jgi:outer membrane lipoprotein-sorting protein